MFFKKRLFTPGPTPVPERVLKAMSVTPLYHRSDEFKEIFLDTLNRLKKLLKTDATALILSSSGTGGMESVVAGLFKPGDKVVVVVGGKFGKRWLEICNVFGLESIVVDVEWGKAVDPGAVEEVVRRNGDLRGILVQICETSTGTLYDVKAIADVASANGIVLIADGITAVGVHDTPMDEWGIDVVVTGSQKALMCPPGLAIVYLSRRAVDMLYREGSGSYYFDLRREIDAQQKGQTAYTPSVNLVFALREALCMMEEEGFESVFLRHAVLSQCVRSAMVSMGLELFSESPANGLTAVKIPDGLDGVEFVRFARELFGATISGGQEHLKGKIFRISHMGYVDFLDVLSGIGVIELILDRMGYFKRAGVSPGAGVSAAIDVFRQFSGS